ncbi:alpha/beta hydrolase [Ktedonosporobacter rubrisoli]|uniref:Alpha/beta hydrolase n=1 Tax=Ktedonosporobacter rubrisoli TaxID=2509675 RepID=A0A4P6JUX2_KTERU|nr:alpha/beta hydrolase [Ktedonosporobacter rubrisoli]QBD79449.1 alpha/beta hydrolase [Ktedonosporobacter rubrisoli]
MQRIDITFVSQGERCGAWLYLPAGSAPFPCVILAHGLGATREMRLDAYATHFVEAGLAALVFDYRGFGASEGVPGLVEISGLLADWAAAIAYARAHDKLDARRIALWGTSLSGGHVIVTAARTAGLAAVVSTNPFTDGLTNLAAAKPLETLPLLGMAIKDWGKGWLKQPPELMKIMGQPGERALFASSSFAKNYQLLVPESVPWANRISARALLQLPFYRPITYAPRVQCPLLLCVGDHDSWDSPLAALKTAQAAPYGEVRHYDCDHYDFYVGPIFEQAVADQTSFLVKNLLP